jgi:hypothetical protein
LLAATIDQLQSATECSVQFLEVGPGNTSWGVYHALMHDTESRRGGGIHFTQVIPESLVVAKLDRSSHQLYSARPEDLHPIGEATVEEVVFEHPTPPVAENRENWVSACPTFASEAIDTP